MNELQAYRELLLREGRQEGEIRGEERGISKMIRRLRKLSLTDFQILESLSEDYGAIFSNDQLEEMLKSTK